MKSCAGCHVGPDDECEAGCPATILVRAGWTDREAETILEGPSLEGRGLLPERDDRDRALAGPLLSDAEHALMDALTVVSKGFRDLIRPGDNRIADGDWAEVASKIHDLQARVMSHAAGRAYPGRYRLLGGRRL